jgi:hypothetical protein
MVSAFKRRIQEKEKAKKERKKERKEEKKETAIVQAKKRKAEVRGKEFKEITITQQILGGPQLAAKPKPTIKKREIPKVIITPTAQTLKKRTPQQIQQQLRRVPTAGEKFKALVKKGLTVEEVKAKLRREAPQRLEQERKRQQELLSQKKFEELRKKEPKKELIRKVFRKKQPFVPKILQIKVKKSFEQRSQGVKGLSKLGFVEGNIKKFIKKVSDQRKRKVEEQKKKVDTSINSFIKRTNLKDTKENRDAIRESIITVGISPTSLDRIDDLKTLQDKIIDFTTEGLFKYGVFTLGISPSKAGEFAKKRDVEGFNKLIKSKISQKEKEILQKKGITDLERADNLKNFYEKSGIAKPITLNRINYYIVTRDGKLKAASRELTKKEIRALPNLGGTLVTDPRFRGNVRDLDKRTNNVNNRIRRGVFNRISSSLFRGLETINKGINLGIKKRQVDLLSEEFSTFGLGFAKELGKYFYNLATAVPRAEIKLLFLGLDKSTKTASKEYKKSLIEKGFDHPATKKIRNDLLGLIESRQIAKKDILQIDPTFNPSKNLIYDTDIIEAGMLLIGGPLFGKAVSGILKGTSLLAASSNRIAGFIGNSLNKVAKGSLVGLTGFQIKKAAFAPNVQNVGESIIIAGGFGLSGGKKIIRSSRLNYLIQTPQLERKYLSKILKAQDLPRLKQKDIKLKAEDFDFSIVKELNKEEADSFFKVWKQQKVKNVIFGSFPSYVTSKKVATTLNLKGTLPIPKDIDMAVKNMPKFFDEFLKNIPLNKRKDYKLIGPNAHGGYKIFRKGTEIGDFKSLDRLRLAELPVEGFDKVSFRKITKKITKENQKLRNDAKEIKQKLLKKFNPKDLKRFLKTGLANLPKKIKTKEVNLIERYQEAIEKINQNELNLKTAKKTKRKTIFGEKAFFPTEDKLAGIKVKPVRKAKKGGFFIDFEEQAILRKSLGTIQVLVSQNTRRTKDAQSFISALIFKREVFLAKNQLGKVKKVNEVLDILKSRKFQKLLDKKTQKLSSKNYPIAKGLEKLDIKKLKKIKVGGLLKNIKKKLKSIIDKFRKRKKIIKKIIKKIVKKKVKKKVAKKRPKKKIIKKKPKKKVAKKRPKKKIIKKIIKKKPKKKIVTKKPSKIPSKVPRKRLSILAISKLPPSRISKFPSKIISKLPSRVISKLPSNVISKLPIKTISKLPPSKISRLPPSKISRLPSRTISKLPSRTISRLPSGIISKLSSKILSKLPNEVLNKVFPRLTLDSKPPKGFNFNFDVKFRERKNPKKPFNKRTNKRVTKFVDVNLPKNRAKKKIFKQVDRTNPRAVSLVLDGLTKKKDIKSPKISGKFRTRKTKFTLRSVEKTKHAIDTRGEKRGLALSKAIKQSLKKKVKIVKRKAKPKSRAKPRKPTRVTRKPKKSPIRRPKITRKPKRTIKRKPKPSPKKRPIKKIKRKPPIKRKRTSKKTKQVKRKVKRQPRTPQKRKRR